MNSKFLLRLRRVSLGLVLGSCFLHAAVAESDCEWLDLFANDSFEHWQQHDGLPVSMNAWSLENGVVHFKDDLKESEDISTKKHYYDFELEFEWKISEAGNSGVKYRISPQNSRLGLEFQLLDDEKHPDNELANHLTGSVYDIAAAKPDKKLKPVGEWNHARIRAHGNNVQHWLNGEMIVEIEIGSSEWIEQFGNSKYSKRTGFGTWTGPILIQDHYDEFWIRNMRVKEL